MKKILIPDDAVLLAQQEGRDCFLIHKPRGFTLGADRVELVMNLSGRRFHANADSLGEIGFTLPPDKKSLMELREIFQRAGYRSAVAAQVMMMGQYARANIDDAPRLRQTDSAYVVHLKGLEPQKGGRLAPYATPAITFDRENFYRLFFITGSERAAAEIQGRDPVPVKTGTIRAGMRDIKPGGAVRLVETAPRGRPTGWEASTRVAPRGTWHGALECVPRKFWKAAGWHSRNAAIRGVMDAYNARGRKKPMAPDTLVTALCLDPPARTATRFRKP